MIEKSRAIGQLDWDILSNDDRALVGSTGESEMQESIA